MVPARVKMSDCPAGRWAALMDVPRGRCHPSGLPPGGAKRQRRETTSEGDKRRELASDGANQR